MRLLGQVQPEAAEHLRGDENVTLDEFLEEHPAPVDVKFQALNQNTHL